MLGHPNCLLAQGLVEAADSLISSRREWIWDRHGGGVGNNDTLSKEKKSRMNPSILGLVWHIFLVLHSYSFRVHCSKNMLTASCSPYLYLHPRFFFWPGQPTGQEGSEGGCPGEHPSTNDSGRGGRYRPQHPLSSVKIFWRHGFHYLSEFPSKTGY